MADTTGPAAAGSEHFANDLQERSWVPPGGETDIQAIRRHFNTVIMIALIVASLLIGGIWWLRVSAYAEILKTFNDEARKLGKPLLEGNAWNDVFIDGLGIVPLVLAAASISLMWWVWNQFRDFTCEVVRGHSKRAELAGKGRFRAWQSVHEPPGDIFTLVGIGCTFLGLAVSLMTLPMDMIGQAFGLTAGADAPAGSLGRSLASAAIVFGASLAIGLVGSMMGIFLSVAARDAAARYCAIVKTGSDFSDDLDKLQTIAADVRAMQTRLDQLTVAVAAVPTAINALPTRLALALATTKKARSRKGKDIAASGARDRAP